MLIHVVFTPESLPELSAENDIAVVIDVLRASTTMCSMLHHGAERIHIASSIDHARQLHASIDGTQETRQRRLLAGEHRGLPPDGFHLGNSPLEASDDSVHGSVITYATTNGTRMVERTQGARLQLIGCFANLSALMKTIVEQGMQMGSNSRLILCCSGNNGEFSLEDTFFAGSFLSHYIANGFSHSLTNAAEAALCIVSAYNQTLSFGSEGSRHGRALASLSLGTDVDVCFSQDVYPVVPVCERMVVRRL
jgi:2-phosphosulfolactate phosphatase